MSKSNRIFKSIYYAVFIAAVVVASGFLYLQYLKQTNGVKLNVIGGTYESSLDIRTQTQKVIINKEFSEELPQGWELLTKDLPDFVKIEENTIKLNPKKSDHGELDLAFAPEGNTQGGRLVRKYQIGLPELDTEALRNEILAIMGNNSSNMGLYFEDFVRNQKVLINENQQFKPGSISKLPVGILTIRDLDSGKRKLTDTFAVQNALKHSRADAIGRLPQGTPVQIKQYIEELFRVSNNTAQYHLRVMLGGMEELNPRTENELYASPFYENPHIASPNAVGRVLSDIYLGNTFSPTWRTYFYDTLGSAAASLKEAIPAGIPKGIRVVNKVGFLFGGPDSTYSDSATVFANNTDYILIIFNNNAPQFPQGSQVLKRISQKVYQTVDQN